MTPTITAFANSPDRGQGLARDMRVRWALEEVGQPYEVRLLSFKEMKEPAHLALNPFGQIPTYEEGELALFETGAIVFHIAERHPGLLPTDPSARARAASTAARSRPTWSGGSALPRCGPPPRSPRGTSPRTRSAARSAAARPSSVRTSPTSPGGRLYGLLVAPEVVGCLALVLALVGRVAAERALRSRPFEDLLRALTQVAA